jgi:hypothetical protein
MEGLVLCRNGKSRRLLLGGRQVGGGGPWRVSIAVPENG